MSKVSNKANSIELSGIRKFFNKVQKVEGAISLTLGQPDFSAPAAIKEGMIKAIEEDKTVYTANAGIAPLREEISKYLKGFDIDFDKEEICVTVGGSEGLMSAFMAVINEGDKILIPSPAYPAYISNTKLCGGIPVEYKLDENDFSIDVKELEKLIDKEKPKAIVVSLPSNPTGAILSKEKLEELYKLLIDKDILIITDEIYTAIYYKEQYYSIAQKKDLSDRIIYISGFSKMFSATGIRIGYVCAKGELFNAILKVHQYNVSCAPSMAQYGVLNGLKHSSKDVEFMNNKFRERRDYVYDRLVKMGLAVNKPEGAFYIFPSIKKFNIKSEEFCDRLLQEKKVAIVPGDAFGTFGEGYIRISYAYAQEQLERALNALEEFIKQL